MKTFKGYIKRNIMWIFVSIVLILFSLLFLYIVNSNINDILYFLLIQLIFVLVVNLFGFTNYHAKIKKLSSIAKEVGIHPIELPEAVDEIDESYGEIIENIESNRLEYSSKSERQKQDMSEYYSMWVHQIKTPIAAMKLLIQVNKNDLDEENKNETQVHMDVLNQKTFIMDMNEELFKIEQYVEMALNYQRLNSTSNDFILEKTNLDEVIRESIRKYAKLMIRKKISITFENSNITALSDKKWLCFVIEQILSNSIKYSREGTINISVIKKLDWCYIVIVDEGIGISEEDLPRVFEKGYTGYNGHLNKHSTGIGLYLSKQIVTKLGHTIEIESTVGAGTRVNIGISLQEKDFRD